MGITGGGRSPGGINIVWNFKRTVRPAQRLAGSGDLVGAEGCAMAAGGAGLGRCAITDCGAAGDQDRAVAGLGGGNGRINGIDIMPVNPADSPSSGFKISLSSHSTHSRLSFKCPASEIAS